MGQRGDSGLIRKGKEKADISAIFNIDSNQQAKLWLEANDYDLEDNLLLRRIISSDGKSKAFINGTPSSVTQLKQLSNTLVDIYSQNSHHSLLHSSTQRNILDGFAKTKDLTDKVSEAYVLWSNLHKEHEEFLHNKTSFIAELEDIEQKYKEFLELDFTDENWNTIQNQHKLINNSTELIEGVQQSLEQLEGSEKNGINDQLYMLKNNLASLSKLDKNLSNTLSIVENSSIELLELSRDLNYYLSSMEINESERKEIEVKIESAFNFFRKYRISSEELTNLSKQWENRINTLTALVREKEKNELLEQAKANYDKLAEELSNKREIAGKKLSEKITDKLGELSFKNARFKVSLLKNDPSSHGNEQVEFHISTHLEGDLRPIQKVASGGELSRISLAIRVSSMTDVDVPVMIFDEVDVGIGGGVAEIVGNLLKSLSEFKGRQIFVITHLPQVAAISNYHFRVSKKIDAQETKSHIELLEKKDRVKEIARMLGGLDITSTTLEHAKEILG